MFLSGTSPRCQAACAGDTPVIPPGYTISTCDLDDCLQCDAEISGCTFFEVAGNTRRDSGILTVFPRECGSLAPHVFTIPT